MWSAAGAVLAFNARNPKFANIGPGLGYAIVFSNQTATDVTAGTFLIEGADADPADLCKPGTWAPLPVQPYCDLPLDNPPNATVTFSAELPLPAGGQCAFAVTCPKQFVRVSPQGASSLEMLVVVTRLQRGGGANGCFDLCPVVPCTLPTPWPPAPVP